MQKTTSFQPKELLAQIYRNPQYSGKHIIIIGGKVYSAKTGKQASALLEMLLKKYPRQVPVVTYIPKADSLMLSTYC
ncbi:MAG: hypothetical protein HY001_05130 [Candidatus Portnoybacteria bacterium]|nr:hypothetical protein [Candidatus Portnoybacteria bacterium]